MDKFHKIENISFRDSYILITVDKKNYKVDLNTQSKKLADSSVDVKKNYIISPSGYGIHWPDIDEDLSIDGLIGIDQNADYHKNFSVRN